MIMRFRAPHGVVAVAWAILTLGTSPVSAQRNVSTIDCKPISEKRSEIGCYVLGRGSGPLRAG